MAETAPGIYSGEFTVGARESYPDAVVVGHLYRGNEAVSLVDLKPFAIETALTVLVTATPEELKADEKSTAKVTVKITDANGNPVAGHKVQFVLATTSQYTGVVGGGAFLEQVGGSIKESTWAETDLFGTVTSTYVAGFAAKTAIIVARDMASNSTGTAVVKTYIQASAQLTLVDPKPSEAADAGYQIKVTARDAWLTADGKSQTRVTATVTMDGEPRRRAQNQFQGHRCRVHPHGERHHESSRARRTPSTQPARRSGSTWSPPTMSRSASPDSVAIELRSDAPAKIAIDLKPDTLPADGRSTADLTVLVTDINDNPNDATEIEYVLASGSGRLREDKGTTDRNGKNTNEYVAGRTAGVVTFELTVRSIPCRQRKSGPKPRTWRCCRRTTSTSKAV